MWNLLNRLGGERRQHSSRSAASARARQARPSLEALEDRRLMSVDVIIRGTPDQDHFVVDFDAVTNETIVRRQLGAGPWVESRHGSSSQKLIITADAGMDTITVERTGNPVDIITGADDDIVSLAPTIRDLRDLGVIAVFGSGGDTLFLHDQDYSGAFPYRITEDGIGLVTYRDMPTVVLNASRQDSEINVLSAPASLTINAGPGKNTITLGNASNNNLDDFDASQIQINGQGGGDTLKIKDRSAVGQEYWIGEVDGTVETGSVGGVERDSVNITYSGVASVELRTGLDWDIFNVYAGPLTTPFHLLANGQGAGMDTLRLTNGLDETWHLNGPGPNGLYTGSLESMTFENIEAVVGSVGRDRFIVDPAAFFLSIDGGGGRDTLDYSAFITPVTVNLGAGTGQGFASVASVENVFGGTHNDNLTGNDDANVLVGGPGSDILNGGIGRDLLIGGVGTDSLDGGADEDILIGGTTSYDADDASLAGLMTEWTRTNVNSSYGTRLANLENGVTAPYATTVRLLRGTTVFRDHSSDTLRGGAGTALDWFFADPDVTNRAGIWGLEFGDATPDRTRLEAVR